MNLPSQPSKKLTFLLNHRFSFFDPYTPLLLTSMVTAANRNSKCPFYPSYKWARVSSPSSFPLAPRAARLRRPSPPRQAGVSGGRNPTRVFPYGQSKQTRARGQGREEASERAGHASNGIAGRAVYHQSGDACSAAQIELPRRPPLSLFALRRCQEHAAGGIWPRPPLLALRPRGTVHATH